MSVVIETTLGDLTVDLFLQDRPTACLNFLKLCSLKYYNYNLFHTIQRDFIAQTGDPTGEGNGGESIWGVLEGPHKRFFEVESSPKILHTSIGLLSLVSNSGNLVGSQFFFTLGADLTSLDGKHCVIGEVVEGHDILRHLNEAIVDDKFRPYQDIRITHTVILEDPYPHIRGFRAPSKSPSPNPKRLQNGRIGADEDIDETEGKTMEEVKEMLAEREAKARATILEIVGDLPDAECAPPENVLFVCKLNPVTTDDDLEIIFSRFGKVNNCEVIRDRKSGDSLQYAFVEFDNDKSCETAYFKMNNVLIDDRRIHVDFSQSVSRVKWRGKGRGVVQHGRIDFNNLREGRSQKDQRNKDEISTEERRKAREKRHREHKSKHHEKDSNSTRTKQDKHSIDGRREHRNERDKNETQASKPDKHRKRHNDDNGQVSHRKNNDSSTLQRKRDNSPSKKKHYSHRDSHRNKSPERKRSDHSTKNKSKLPDKSTKCSVTKDLDLKKEQKLMDERASGIQKKKIIHSIN